jgi:hypothetical protein
VHQALQFESASLSLREEMEAAFCEQGKQGSFQFVDV